MESRLEIFRPLEVQASENHSKMTSSEQEQMFLILSHVKDNLETMPDKEFSEYIDLIKESL